MAKAITIPVQSVRENSSARLGLIPLVALVVGSMIGGGVFSLPQNMAKGASPGAVLIGWLIAGVGMLALAFVYQGCQRESRRLMPGLIPMPVQGSETSSASTVHGDIGSAPGLATSPTRC